MKSSHLYATLWKAGLKLIRFKFKNLNPLLRSTKEPGRISLFRIRLDFRPNFFFKIQKSFYRFTTKLRNFPITTEMRDLVENQMISSFSI